MSGHKRCVGVLRGSEGPVGNDDRRERLAQLFRTYAEEVSDYVAHHYLRADVDDIVSITFETAGKRLEVIEIGKERAWLFAVARNFMQNGRRGRRRRANFEQAVLALRPRLTVELGDEQILVEDIEPIRRGFKRLSARDQEIVLLVVWADFSTPELADVLGVDMKTASDWRHRATSRFRDRVNEERHHG